MRFSSTICFVTLMFLFSPSVFGGDVLDEITRQQAGQTRRFSTGVFDPESNADAYHLRPGERKTFAELEGPGEIRHIWFTISNDRRYPRTLVFRIYWDDSEVPSVEAPIGDFFAAGNGMKANVSTLPMEVTSYGRALNSYWHMPFRKKARIVLENQSKNRMCVYCQIDWMQLPALPENTLYFHARYHQEFPVKPFSPYTIFEGQGEGQYVGQVLSSQNSFGSWYGESDDRYYIDGEETPSLVGSGTEDFFTDAWNLRLFTNLNAGVTICEPNGVDSRRTAYRWHIQAPVIFRKSLKVEIERRSYAEVIDPATGKRVVHDFVYRPDFFSSVAFWYQKGIAKPFCELPPVEARLNPEVWVEVKDIADKLPCSEGLRPIVRSNRTCFQKTMLFVENKKPGAWFEVPVDIPEEGQYSISCFQSLFPEYGMWKVSLTGRGVNTVLDSALDFHDPYVSLKENWPESIVYGTAHEAKLGIVRLKPGRFTLRFECVGCNPLSRVKKTGQPGYSLGMDAISFRKLPWNNLEEWIADYLVKDKDRTAEFESLAQTTVKQLAEAVERFARDTGEYPKTLDELLAKPPRLASAAGQWPYFTGSRIPLDPWGQPYLYAEPGSFNPQSFDLYSVRGNSRNPAKWIGNWENPYRLRDAIEGESLIPIRNSSEIQSSVQELATNSIPPNSQGKHLFIKSDKKGDKATFVLPPGLKKGRYAVTIYVVTSWDYGIVQWSLDGQPLGKNIDGYSPTTLRQPVAAGEISLEDGKHELKVQALDRNNSSTGFKAGLDAIYLKPLP